MNKIKVLIIEDNISINDILSFSLKKEGFETRSAFNGSDGIDLLEVFNPHIVILDLMLPDISGYEVCKKINSKYPTIIVSAKNDIIDKLLGLELGADDYITKPFDIREVILRIRVLLRRIEIKAEEEIVNISSYIRIDKIAREVTVNDEIVELKPKEYQLLMFLYKNKNQVFSREQLLDRVWGYDFDGDLRTVDVHIRRLRSKIDIKNQESVIKTVFGVGYALRGE